MATKPPAKKRPKRRAIALGGGGPVAGFHLGVLEVLESKGITFDVWSLSCIGAWVGIYFNTVSQPSGRAKATYDFFESHAFRDTDSYEGFPINKVFAPNFQAYAKAWSEFVREPRNYLNATLGSVREWPEVRAGWMRALTDWTLAFRAGDLNLHLLNNVLAVHPVSRFLTSMIYQSDVNGLSTMYYEDSTLLEHFDIQKLDLVDVPGLWEMGLKELRGLTVKSPKSTTERARTDQPEIYHNAYRLENGESGGLRLFNNKWFKYWTRDKNPRTDYLPISIQSLCACSALPYVEQTVRIPNDDGRLYSEGALEDTVNVRNLVEDHPNLDEIWVVRLIDYKQVRAQKNLHDALANLCQEFAAAVGEDDVSAFRGHLRKTTGRTPRVIEIPLVTSTKINFRWDRKNLETARNEGRTVAKMLFERQPDLEDQETTAPAWSHAGQE